MPPYLPPSGRRTLPAIRSAPAQQWAFERDEPEMSLAPMDLRQILGILRRRIWIILAITALGAGVAAYFALTAVPVYEAKAVIRLADDRRQLTQGLLGPAEDRPGLTADPVLSEIAVLTSRAIAGHVVDSMPELRLRATGFPSSVIEDFAFTVPPNDSLRLPSISLAFGEDAVTASTARGERVQAPYGVPIELAGLRFTVASAPDEEEGTLSVLRHEDAAGRLARAIKAMPREGTNVIDVAYESSDPRLAQRVVNTLVQVFKEANIADAAQEARLRRQFIETQLRQNDSLLTAARLAVSDFRSSHRTFSAREKFTTERGDLAQLEQQQRDLDLQRNLYASVLQRLENNQGRESQQELGALLSAQGASASPIVVDLYQQIERLEGARDSVTTGRWASAPTNPDVQRLDSLLASTRDRLRKLVQQIIATLDDRRASLARVQAQSAAALVRIPATDAEEARLMEREEAYRKIADQLREELQRARLAEAAEVGQIEIVDLAATPRAPIGVPMSQKILFGVLLGLFLGAGYALVVEHLDTSIRGRDDVEASLQLPGLAVIPKFDVRGAGRRLLPGSGAGTNGAGKQGGKTRRALPVSGALVTVGDVRSVGAEAYRTLRTKLLFSRAVGSLKTIVITSPFTQDGKSTVAANLATTFAQHGMRTLLIDCDLRKPTQHEIFQVSREPGLTELLAGDGLVAGTGRRTSVEGLSLITAGALPLDPAEVLGSPRMREVLAKLADAFDVVVLDSPPVLPVADPAILASIADGVLLVVRAGATNRRAAQLAVQQLQDVDARILGAVLNDPNAQAPRYDAYSYAAYYGYEPKG